MSRTFSRRSAFTLVEMLVVLAIIGILAALLLPAVMSAIVRARTAAVAIEVNQLASAIESYKQDKGDYPPNFRDPAVIRRHVNKCYPKADPTYVQSFVTLACDETNNKTMIDEGESLVFWLAMTDNDPRYPFLSYLGQAGRTPNPKKYYPFDETRLQGIDGSNNDFVPSYIAKNCQDTFYLYIDSRSYDRASAEADDLAKFTTSGDAADRYAFAEDTSKGVQPYWSDSPAISVPSGATKTRDLYKPINPTTFQLICAGLDGEFGFQPGADSDVRQFPSGTNFNTDDRDNITNFSNGKPLSDSFQ
jgi:prepilin-type N-terminal cleavage/methylation domain-containing protein